MAVFITVIGGSIVQTQFNLAEIASLGAAIDIGTRLATTWHDLIYFSPIFAILIAIAFAVAWPVAALLQRWFPAQRTLLFVLAGGSSVWTLLAIMNQALPVTAIAASRTPVGSLALASVGLLAGWIYSKIMHQWS